MWKAVRENPRAVTYAVLMHLGLLLLLVFSLDWTPKISRPASPQAIQAELVDNSQLKAIEENKQAEQRRLKAEQEAQQQAATAEKQRKAEAARKQQAEQEAQRKAEAARKRQAEQEAQRKAEAARKLKAKQEAERKAEAARKQQAAEEAERKAAAEKQRKAEAERKRKAAAEAARQREAEAALQAQLQAEQELAQAKSALAQYIPYIKEKVQRSWLRPAGSPAGLSCLVQVRLIPGGDVASAQVIQGSGDPLFDRSVETAVLKASPLPLPTDASLFNHFREINFKFSPR